MVPPAPGRRRRWQTNCQVLDMSIKSALFAFAFSGRRRVERPRRFAFVGNFLRFESFLFLWHSGNAGAFRERERGFACRIFCNQQRQQRRNRTEQATRAITKRCIYRKEARRGVRHTQYEKSLTVTIIYLCSVSLE